MQILVISLEGVMQSGDVRVIERGQKLNFASQPRGGVHRGGSAHDLQGFDAAREPVPDLVHLSHAAGSGQAQNDVVPHCISGT